MILYNLFPLLAGPFGRWASHIERATDLGFDWIFVNPVQKCGRSGSLYSIADYFDLNPALVDPNSQLSPDDQLREAIRSGEKRGLRFMVDLVINHAATDTPLAREHPSWFARQPDGGLLHPSCDDNGETVVWEDLVSFDHRHAADREGLYQYFRRVVEHLIALGFTGFRCDAAYQVPRDLWQRLMTETRRDHPGIVFAAETLGCSTQQTRETAEAGFDYIFNSSKWWDFESPWLMEQHHLLRSIAPSISFPESHDTERLLTESGGNVGALKQRYLFAAFFSAGVMMPIGFEFGFRRRLHVVETRPEDWEEPSVDLCDFVRTVNAVKRRYPIFSEESINEVLPCDNPRILLLWKASPGSTEEALVILNKDPHARQRFYTPNLHTYIQGGGTLVDESPEYPMKFLPRPYDYELNPGQGLVLVLPEAGRSESMVSAAS